MMGSFSSMKATALILTARKRHWSLGVGLSSCRAIGKLYLHIVRTLSSVSTHSSHCLTVQQSDDDDCYSDSDRDSYADDSSESGDEKYGMSRTVKL
jgi:hypothetical protein